MTSNNNTGRDGKKDRILDRVPSDDASSTTGMLLGGLSLVGLGLGALATAYAVSKLEKPIETHSGPAKPPTEINQLKVWYATNRVPIPSGQTIANGIKDFSGIESGSSEPHLGVVDVSLQLQNSNFGSRVEKITSLGKDQFYSDMKSNGGKVLVFIHGFNNSFMDASGIAARLAYDCRFDGKVVFYSWPSVCNLQGYHQDEDIIQCAEDPFVAFLTLLIHVSSEVHIIAHSMGNRLLTRSLERLSHNPAGLKDKLGQIILAAPDVNQGFLSQKIIHFLHAKRVTIYVCQSDKALRISGLIHGNNRVGFNPNKYHEKVDTIQVDYNTGFLSHSYFADTQPLKDDIYLLINYNTDPGYRLRLKQVSGKTEDGVEFQYWKLRDRN